MGRRFCSLDQTHLKCKSTLVEIMPFRPRIRVKTTKKEKRFSPNIESFCPQNHVKTKKKERSLPQFGTKFGQNLWDLFVLPSLFRLFNQRSNLDGGTLNLDWGTLNLDGDTLPPYNLSTDCITFY